MVSSIKILKTVYGGDGMGRLGDGRVVFVPGTFAGEQVKAEIIAEKKNFVKARLIEIEESSPNRTGNGEVPVPGAVFWNLSYKGECGEKALQLQDFFDRARITIPCAVKTLPSAPVDDSSMLNYRNKVVYRFAMRGKTPVMGYLKEPSHEIVDMPSDTLACPEINASLPEIRESVFRLLTTGPVSVRKHIERKETVTVRYAARSGIAWWIGDAPNDVILKESTCGRRFDVPADGFYQINGKVGEALVKSVVSRFNLAPTAEVVDLYCGVGVFGICMSPQKLVGIESGRRAVEFAKINAKANSVESASFFSGQAAKELHRFSASADTTIVVDPPRGGLERKVADTLARSLSPRIFYVSCDPATLMRDLRILSHTYEVEDVEWFNMFPRTARFETLVVLRKKKSK